MAGRAISGLALLSFSVLTTDPHHSITRKDFIYFALLTFMIFVYCYSSDSLSAFLLTCVFTSGRLKTEYHKQTWQCTVTIVFPRASMSLWWETRTLKIIYCFLQAKLIGIWLILSVPEMCQCLVINNLSHFQVPSLI